MAITKAEYGDTPFNIINNSNILTEADFNGLSEMTDELKETFLNLKYFRTRTEMEGFSS